MKIKIGKVLVAGIVVGVLNTAWGWLTCGWLFNWVYSIEPVSVWKLDTEMPFGLMAIAGVIFSVLLAFVYAVVNKSLPGKNIFIKGICFGIIVWLVGSLPGNAGLGMCTQIAPQVINYWIISFLAADLWKGLVIAAIYGKDE